MPTAKTTQLATALFAALVLVGCGEYTSTTPPLPSTAPAASVTADPLPAITTSMPPPPEAAPSAEAPPVYTEPAVAEGPYIVDCQMGMGPIVTHWSDGATTGYSDYCQSAHDQALQSEIDANTPTCNGVTCTYPNGATVPDRDAAPAPAQSVPDDRCTNQINYAGDPRSNAEINSIGAQTGHCPQPTS